MESILLQGSHRPWKTWKTWKTWKIRHFGENSGKTWKHTLKKKLLRENILYLQDTQGKIIFGNKFNRS